MIHLPGKGKGMHTFAAISLLLLFKAAPFASAQSADIPVEGYHLAWSDEFNGTAMDTTKWDYRDLGPRRDAVNVKDTVSLDGKGHLVLTTKRVGDAYHTAMIGTQGKFEAVFGYFECRVQFQKEIGHWSAFWLQTPTMGQEIGNPAKAGTEIDVVEYLPNFGDDVSHTLHWDGYKDDHKSTHRRLTVPGVSKGWHTIGLLWTPEEYVFYVDGNETWRSDQAVSKRSEYIILSLEVGKWAGDIAKAKLPDSLTVDYVRVYQKDPAEHAPAGDGLKTEPEKKGVRKK